MMARAPYRWHQTIVPLPPEEVEERLANATGPDRTFRGQIANGKVRIARGIVIHNPFLPHLTAIIEPTSNGTRCRYRVGLHPLVPPLALLTVASFVWAAVYGTLPGWYAPLAIGALVVTAVVTYWLETPRLLLAVAAVLDLEPPAP